MKISKSKTLSRITLLCILLGIFPAIFVGVFSYNRASAVVQDKVEKSNMQLLMQTRLSVEQMLTISDRSLFNFVDSLFIRQNYDNSMNPANFQMVNEVSSALNSLQAYDVGIFNAYLVNFDRNWVFDNDGFHRLDAYNYQEEMKSLADIPKQMFWINEGALVESQSAPKGVLRVLKIPINAPATSGFAAILLPYSKLSSLITTNNNQLGSVMVLDSNFRVLAGNDRKLWNKDLSAEAYLTSIRESNQLNGCYTASIDNKKYKVTFLKSDYNNWIYLSITNIDSVLRDSRAIGWFTFTICLVVVLLMIVVSVLVSRNIYSPIYRIYRLILGKQEQGSVNEDSHRNDEYRLIQEKIENLMKDNSLLKNEVISQLPHLKEYFSLKLVLGEAEQSDVDDKLDMYGYPMPRKWMCVLVLRFDPTEDAQYPKKDLDLALFAIKSITGDVVSGDLMLNPLILNKSEVIVIGSDIETYQEFRNFAYNVAEKLQSIVEKTLPLTVSIGISRPFHSYREIRTGVLEGQDALKHQIKLGYNVIINIQDVLPDHNVKFIFPADIENNLLNAVDACDTKMSREYMHAVLEKIFSIDMNHNEYMVSLTKLLVDLLHLMQKYGKLYPIKDDEQGKSVFEQLFELRSVNETEKWFNSSVIDPMIKKIMEVSKKHHSRIIEDIMRMIHEEYDSDLTLDECSSRLNYHPSYIRRILKNEAGIVFYDYLSEYRINMAKQWLSDTDIKIQDIAMKLRFNNPQNFIRSFKKANGMTPGQYRDGASK